MDVRSTCGRSLRRAFAPIAALAMTVSLARLPSARGEDLAVPARVEAELVGRAASYDREFAARAGEKVLIAIVTVPSDPDSARAAAQLLAAFREVGSIAGLPHEELILPWKDGGALAEECVHHKVAIAFLTPGLGRDIDSVVKALEGSGILSVAGVLSYVSRGAILGFDLVSGRPKIVINLTIAKKQGLAFRADLLRLARVIQ